MFRRFFKWPIIVLAVSTLCICIFLYQNIQTKTSPGLTIKKIITGVAEKSSRFFNPQENTTMTQLHLRSQHLKEVCQQTRSSYSAWENKPKPVHHQLYINQRHKLLYCNVEKIGSSFWKRVFKVIDQSNNNTKTVFDMTGMSAHFHIPKTVLFDDLPPDEATKALTGSQYHRFMFTRDPFARLFSAYVDKMLVPNSLGKKIGLKIKHLKISPETQPVCVDDLTFEQACRYVVDSIQKGRTMDPHFAPISDHCNVCQMNYTLIGKLETFMEDTRAILESSGVDMADVVGPVDKVNETSDLGIMKDVLDRVIKDMRRAQCKSRLQGLKDVWTCFQVRGFISKHIPFPEKLLVPELIKGKFFKAVKDAYKNSGSRDARLKQREEAMLEAYRTVPFQVLKNLSFVFQRDCELFGYSCNVEERFFAGVGDVKPFYFKDS